MLKRILFYSLSFILLLCLLVGCSFPQIPATQPSTEESTQATAASTQPSAEATQPATQETSAPTVPSETEAPATTAPTEPEHSALYIPGVSVDDVITWFNEVCLNAEFVESGDPTKLQKWVTPIRYVIVGSYTDEDMAVLEAFVHWLNTLEGFPAIHEVEDAFLANLVIHFCDEEEYLALMGDDFVFTDGGVKFWYNGANQIYDAIIAYRTDIDQHTRNSVILEEIYNGLGPVCDTQLRLDSIIYSGYSTPQSLTPVDELIIRLLYHPEMKCGMSAVECEAVIRALYY